MKAPLFLCFLLLNSYSLFAQPKDAVKTLNNLNVGSIRSLQRARLIETSRKNENISDFSQFYIPSAITSEGIEPASVSNLNVNFGDDKVKLKWGFSYKENKDKFIKSVQV